MEASFDLDWRVRDILHIEFLDFELCTLFSAIFHCPLCLMSTYLVPKSRSEHVHYNRDFKL